MNRKSTKVINIKNKTIYRRLKISKNRRCDAPHNTSGYLISLYERFTNNIESNIEEYCRHEPSTENMEESIIYDDFLMDQSIQIGGSMMGIISSLKLHQEESYDRSTIQENGFSPNKPLYCFKPDIPIENFQ